MSKHLTEDEENIVEEETAAEKAYQQEAHLGSPHAPQVPEGPIPVGGNEPGVQPPSLQGTSQSTDKPQPKFKNEPIIPPYQEAPYSPQVRPKGK